MWDVGYFVSEQHELAEDGEGFQILREGPGVVPDERFVEWGVEEQCEDGSQTNQVVGLDGIQILVVAGFEQHDDAVQDIGREESGDELLDLEDEVAGGVVGEVALGSGGFTRKNRKRTNLTLKMMV